MDSLLHTVFDRPQLVSERRETILPSVADLVDVALTQTDFLGDLDTQDLGWIDHIAANSIDAAADLWAETRPDWVTIPLPLIMAARRELCTQAQSMLADMAEAEADRIRDAQDAGDCDAAGDPIAYPKYRGA